MQPAMNSGAGQPAAPGLEALLQALMTGGQPQGNLANMSPLFSLIGGQVPPVSPGMAGLAGPFGQKKPPNIIQAFGG